jgi:GNAT superfamily N-acetyltransferase
VPPPRPVIRPASSEDIPAIIALLADDAIGAGRETVADLEPYRRAWEAIAANPAARLVVADAGGVIAGTLQLDLLDSLTRGGMRRAQVEGVRVAHDARGGGVGRLLLEWAIDEARREGCGLIQLTSDLRRDDAARFYEALGFTASHRGFKLALT